MSDAVAKVFKLFLTLAAWSAGTTPVLARGWKEAEASGDRWDSQARASYQKALEAWSQVERYTARLEDRPAIEASRRQRAGLTISLRDAKGFQALAPAGGSPAPQALPLTFPALRVKDGNYQLESIAAMKPAGPSSLPAEDDLKELSRFLTQAGRNFFDLKEKEERDLPLLFEALALSYRLLGDFYQARGDADFRDALALIDEEPRPAVKSGNPAADPESLAEKSAASIRLRFKLRDFSGAHETFLAAGVKDQNLRGKERVSYLQMVRDLARFRGDSERILALNDQLIKLGAKAEDNPPPLAPFSNFISGKAVELARVSKILLNLLAALELSPRERALALYIGATATMEAGQPALASEILARSKSDLQGDLEPWLAARLSVTAADARERIGDYESSLSAYEQAAARLKDLPATKSMAGRVELNTASILLRLGKLSEARELAAQLLRRSDAPPELKIRARILLGDCNYFTISDSLEEERRLVEDALSAYQLAARELQQNSSAGAKIAAELQVQIQIHLGNATRRLALISAAPKEAEELRRRAVQAAKLAMRLAQEGGLDRLASVAAANLGELHLELGEFDAARELCSWALQKAQEMHNFECEWRARWYLGRLADATGDEKTAQKEFEQAAALIESYRLQVLGPLLKSGYMTTKRAFYESLLARCMKQGDARAAFFAAERARARAFVESLGLRFLLLATDKDQQLYREYISLLGRLEVPEYKSGSVLATFKRSSESYEEVRQKLQELLGTIRNHPAVSPLVKALVEGAPADAAAAQRSLKDGEVLIEYASSGDSLVAFTAAAGRFEAIDLRVSPVQTLRQVRAFLEKGAADEALARALYDSLIAPIAATVETLAKSSEKIPEVTIVPWGPMFRLPFETLRSGKSYLIEKWQIAYLPSASVLRYLPRDAAEAPPRSLRLVAFVDPDTDYNGDGKPDYPKLAFARAEVSGIAPLFAKQTILEGASALEETYNLVAAEGDVFHLACHGEFFPSRPMDSSLYLAKSQAADGRLRASEIFAIDLRHSRLITLSGCETARMEIYAGDDPVGIGTSLLHSGARALLASLWKVEDEATAGLMLNFYRNWLGSSGGNRAQALRQAKLTLLREGKFTAPRQWAAFILIGIK